MSYSVSGIVLGNLALVLGIMVALWLVSVRIRDSSIVDLFWGLGFAVIAWATLWRSGGVSPRAFLLVLLTTVWSLRYSWHVWRRNIGHGEDYRYASMREATEAKGRSWATRSLYVVFLLQGVIMWLVSLPVQFGQLYAEPITLGWPAMAGLALWIIGVLFEAVGDAQLKRFRRNPENRGTVLQTGLWRYTRHPNYFGNACLWWGIWLCAMEVDAAAWAFLSPVLMTWALLKFSGVPILEKHMAATRPGYADYMKRTSMFFPLPPKKAAAHSVKAP